MRQRQQKIIEYVQKVGIASYDELAQLFNVSSFTIRRDISYLAQARLLAKVKGGAQRIERPSQFSEASLPHRLQINLAQKEKIAAKAIELILPGDTVFLDGSSTITCFARAIARACHNITVVTNSILVALELSESPDIRLVGLGGVFDRETFSFVGFGSDFDNSSDERLAGEATHPIHAETTSFYVDKAFFSCAGFIPDEGTFENAAFNRNTKRLIAQRADKTFVLIDSSKFGKRALARVLDCQQIDSIVTEQIEPETAEKLRQSSIDLILPNSTKGVSQ